MPTEQKVENVNIEAKRVNWKYYLPLSLASTAILAFFCQSMVEIYVLVGIYLVVVINHLLLVKATGRILFSEKGKSTNIVLLNLIKFGLLFLALSLGVHFIGNGIVIPIINYCFQMVVLSVSLK